MKEHRNLFRFFKQEELEHREFKAEGSNIRESQLLFFRKPGSLGIPGDIPPIISAAFGTEVDDLLEHAGSFWQSLLLPSSWKSLQLKLKYMWLIALGSIWLLCFSCSCRSLSHFLNPTCTLPGGYWEMKYMGYKPLL